MVDDQNRAEHALVKVGNLLVDADGPLPVKKKINAFQCLEHVAIAGIRELLPGDLPNAPRATEAQILVIRKFLPLRIYRRDSPDVLR
jgi:hypothetical protein